MFTGMFGNNQDGLRKQYALEAKVLYYIMQSDRAQGPNRQKERLEVISELVESISAEQGGGKSDTSMASLHNFVNLYLRAQTGDALQDVNELFTLL